MIYKRLCNCFILTMWYVNFIGSVRVKMLLLGFILTMWYVNF